MNNIFNPAKKVLCIGEALFDCLPGGELPGGAPMNVAIHLAQLGIEVSFASCVGNDDHGKRLIRFLSEKNIPVELVQQNNNYPTGLVKVDLDANKNATYTICEPAAWDFIEPTKPLLATAETADILIFGSLASRGTTSRETISDLINSAKTALFDINLRTPYDTQELVEPLLYKSHILKINDDELVTVARWNNLAFGSINDAVCQIAEKYQLRAVITTKGKDGALVYAHKQFIEHPGYKATVVDTIGAGDSFLAAFVASLTKGHSAQTALDFACKTGAFVVGQKGATPIIPNELIL